MEKFTKNEINRILNKPELYEAVMRYDYLLNNRNKIDEIYKYFFVIYTNLLIKNCV